MDQNNIVKWVQYDNKIKEYNEKSKQLREQRDLIGSSMIESFSSLDNKSFPTINITQMNTSLSFQKSKTYENYTNKFYKDCFTEFLGSEEKANELIQFMKNKRKVEEKIILKRGNSLQL